MREPQEKDIFFKGVPTRREPPHGRNPPKVYTFSELQIEVAKLKSMGLTLREIGEKIGREKDDVSAILSRFEPVAMRMYSAVKELREAGYWNLIATKKIKPTILSSGREKRKNLLLEGFWPFAPRLLPFGYKIGVDRKIEVDPEKAIIVKRVFERICKGEPPYRVAREEGFRSPQHISREVKNPFYVGYIKYGAEIYPGKHEPLIDKETWERATSFIEDSKGKLGGVFNPPVGFKRVGCEIKIDEERAVLVKKVFKLRCFERRTINEIAKETGLTYGQIQRMFHNPHYKKIVGNDLWEKTQNVRISRWEIAKRKRSLLKTKILLFLKDKPNGCWLREISKGTGISSSAITRILKEMELEGSVWRVYGVKSKKHAKGKWKIFS
jgi:DNA-binding MarR family transcriptional regulator